MLDKMVILALLMGGRGRLGQNGSELEWHFHHSDILNLYFRPQKSIFSNIFQLRKFGFKKYFLDSKKLKLVFN